jgi:hypothetical protein
MPDHRRTQQHDAGHGREVDRWHHGAVDGDVHVLAISPLGGCRPGGLDEVLDGTCRAAATELDPAEFVHRAAVSGIERERAFLVIVSGLEVVTCVADQAGDEMHLRLVWRELAGFGRRPRGGIVAPGQFGLRQTGVGMPVIRRQLDGLGRRGEGRHVVAEVPVGDAGQPVWPVVRRRERDRAASRIGRLLVLAHPQVSGGEQTPRPAVRWLARHDMGQQAGRLAIPFEAQHHRGPGQILCDRGHSIAASSGLLVTGRAIQGKARVRSGQAPVWPLALTGGGTKAPRVKGGSAPGTGLLECGFLRTVRPRSYRAR